MFSLILCKRHIVAIHPANEKKEKPLKIALYCHSGEVTAKVLLCVLEVSLYSSHIIMFTLRLLSLG